MLSGWVVIVYTVTDTTFRKTQPSLLKVYHLGELQAGRCNIYRTLASVRNGLHKPKDFRWQTSNHAGPLPPLCGSSLEGNQTSAWGLLVGLPQAYKLKTSSLRNPSSNCSSSVFETTFACAPHPHSKQKNLLQVSVSTYWYLARQSMAPIYTLWQRHLILPVYTFPHYFLSSC